MEETTRADSYLEQFSRHSPESDLAVEKRLKLLPRKLREAAILIFNPQEKACRIDLDMNSRIKSLSWTQQVDKFSPEEIKKAKMGEWSIYLSDCKPVPHIWFPELNGLKVLCLAFGGGQQAPIFAFGITCPVIMLLVHSKHTSESALPMPIPT